MLAGVSNFGLQELAKLVAAARVQPSVVQAHSDPLSANVPLQAFCARAGIQFQVLFCRPGHSKHT